MDIRGILVLDIGSTNTKALLFDADLNVVREQSRPSAKCLAPPYAAIDPAPILDLVAQVIPEFDAVLPVDAIVPCTHGSAFALLDAHGDLALPMMDYVAQPPQAIVEDYAALAPDFAEVLAPVNPGALTVGRQFLWQQRVEPEAFARVRTIVPFAQAVAHWLGGRAVTEATSMGAQTQLWNLREGYPSSLAKARGWAERIAEVAPAWAVVGHIAGLRGRGEIRAGIHDSSANYLRYMGGETTRFVLLSTGTWIIGFDAGADLAALNPAYDVACGLTVHGTPVPICRFQGGKEFGVIAGDTAGSLEEVVASGAVAWPNFTDSGGPVPGRKGRIEGEASAALASLYCAQMTALALERMAGDDPAPRVIVDGPFGQNEDYLGALATLLPGQAVYASTLREGTAAGAALLGLMGADGKVPPRAVPLREVKTAQVPGLAGYHARWRAGVLG